MSSPITPYTWYTFIYICLCMCPCHFFFLKRNQFRSDSIWFCFTQLAYIGPGMNMRLKHRLASNSASLKDTNDSWFLAPFFRFWSFTLSLSLPLSGSFKSLQFHPPSPLQNKIERKKERMNECNVSNEQCVWCNGIFIFARKSNVMTKKMKFTK